MSRYILVNGEPVREPDLLTWATWFEETSDRILRQDTIGDYLVSTVFLGLDHGFPPGHGDPVLWETMVFPRDSWTDLASERYTSRAEALAGHEAACERVRLGEITG